MVFCFVFDLVCKMHLKHFFQHYCGADNLIILWVQGLSARTDPYQYIWVSQDRSVSLYLWTYIQWHVKDSNLFNWFKKCNVGAVVRVRAPDFRSWGRWFKSHQGWRFTVTFLFPHSLCEYWFEPRNQSTKRIFISCKNLLPNYCKINKFKLRNVNTWTFDKFN